MPKLLAMALQGRDDLRGIGRRAGLHTRLGNDTPVHFREPELAPELDGLARLVALDDLRVRLEEADQLLRRGHLLAAEHAARGLLRSDSHKRWLVPLVVFLCLTGLLLLLATTVEALAPFIYSIF